MHKTSKALMMKIKYPILLLVILISFPFFSQQSYSQSNLNGDTTNHSSSLFREDDPILAMLDSLANVRFFESDNNHLLHSKSNDYNFAEYQIPVYPDSVYAERIASLNEQSPFEYVFNQEVKEFIELYAVKKRQLTARIMGLASLYFPLFEEQLDKYNMPLELKYLAVIESALNPIATSRAGAKGLWQFMYGTGKVYGLKVTSYTDDRYDPYKSTIAACEHLKDLYDIYGSWSLALAAYNSGAGNVNKAIRRSGGLKSFWSIQRFLPRETRAYVPAFIAVSYVMNYAKEHNLYPANPGILYYDVDTVTVKSILTLDQVSEMLNIPMEEVKFLNPAYKQGVIPANKDNTFMLRLRKKYVGDFINNEASLYAFKTKKGLEQEALLAIATEVRDIDYHYVKSGESLGSIARKYHTSVDQIKRLNGLKSTVIRPKQRLIVYAPSSTAKPKITQTKPVTTNTHTSAPQPETSDTSAQSLAAVEENGTNNISEDTPPVSPRITHTVVSGETLSLISRKYGCTVDELKSWNNLSENTIRVNQKLIIYKGSAPATTSVTKPQTASARYHYYTIQKGDNLWDIAQKYDVTVADIKRVNSIRHANLLRPGQKIKIPK
ncbi:MAG: LysM peptidoglycan-binding domain-containing protein [Bacteroidetes bacterium]|nr:LysM peptidoglycan-binding domain-containing protein [Bacteroidota bacterium]